MAPARERDMLRVEVCVYTRGKNVDLHHLIIITLKAVDGAAPRVDEKRPRWHTEQQTMFCLYYNRTPPSHLVALQAQKCLWSTRLATQRALRLRSRYQRHTDGQSRNAQSHTATATATQPQPHSHSHTHLAQCAAHDAVPTEHMAAGSGGGMLQAVQAQRAGAIARGSAPKRPGVLLGAGGLHHGRSTHNSATGRNEA